MNLEGHENDGEGRKEGREGRKEGTSDILIFIFGMNI